MTEIQKTAMKAVGRVIALAGLSPIESIGVLCGLVAITWAEDMKKSDGQLALIHKLIDDLADYERRRVIKREE